MTKGPAEFSGCGAEEGHQRQILRLEKPEGCACLYRDCDVRWNLFLWGHRNTLLGRTSRADLVYICTFGQTELNLHHLTLYFFLLNMFM